MWTAILAGINWLSGGTFTAIANGVVAVLNKKTDAKIKQIETDGAVDVATIQGGVVILQAQAGIYQQRWGWWGTRWMAMGASVPAIIHTGAVYLDSTFKFGWAIAKAPGVYEGLEVQIILGCVGILTAQSIFSRR